MPYHYERLISLLSEQNIELDTTTFKKSLSKDVGVFNGIGSGGFVWKAKTQNGTSVFGYSTIRNCAENGIYITESNKILLVYADEKPKPAQAES